MRLACRTRPWLQSLGIDALQLQLADILRTIAGIGYMGVETVLPVILAHDTAAFRQWRTDGHDLILAAAHHEAPWWDLSPAAIAALDADLARLVDLGAERLAISIPREIADLDADAIRRTAATLGSLAARAPLDIVVHNHWWEVVDDFRILHLLFDSAAGSPLRLGADFGWVAYAGADPVAFAREFASLITYAHAQDYDRELGFIEVGRGSMPWPDIVAELRIAGYDGWLTAESDYDDIWRGSPDPATSASLQFAGLTRLLH